MNTSKVPKICQANAVCLLINLILQGFELDTFNYYSFYKDEAEAEIKK